MENRPYSLARLAALAAIGSAGAFVLLQLWMFTARFPWSSDAWLIDIAIGVVACGPLAVVAAAVLYRWKGLK